MPNSIHDLPREIRDEVFDIIWRCSPVVRLRCAPGVVRIVVHGHGHAQMPSVGDQGRSESNQHALYTKSRTRKKTPSVRRQLEVSGEEGGADESAEPDAQLAAESAHRNLPGPFQLSETAYIPRYASMKVMNGDPNKPNFKAYQSYAGLCQWFLQDKTAFKQTLTEYVEPIFNSFVDGLSTIPEEIVPCQLKTVQEMIEDPVKVTMLISTDTNR